MSRPRPDHHLLRRDDGRRLHAEILFGLTGLIQPKTPAPAARRQHDPQGPPVLTGDAYAVGGRRSRRERAPERDARFPVSPATAVPAAAIAQTGGQTTVAEWWIYPPPPHAYRA